ncbi:hypothetical protein MKW98_005392 [Papaver atlanticum]|uniref:F-box associated beta-propeller type 3 domain-containing protein n=1 Tax=Papaver atlanticum TaxID=357466 RepID=A0AAD4RXH0_9MAGN|nr:hypothetical protein MKW98_005392 [Papaver atlanticum]
MFNKIGCLIDFWNYTTKEFLRIVPPVIGGGYYYKIRSSGFGFDSINNEYKLVIIVYMLETKSPKCLVYTFGIKSSWTEVRSPDSGLLLTSTYGATGGAGALFWRTSDPQVILLFDLHEDKLQYIRIPVERNAVKRLFEHKKSFVVAILQKKSLPVEGINTKTAHTLEKVHLKILKAYKDDQVWDKETIDLSTYSIPFSDNFRFVSFSDQILLYWADPKSSLFFNLHRKCLKVVKNICSGMSKKRLPRAAGAKDYWLNCEVENICSLKALLPVRAQKSDRAALNSMMESFQNMWTLQQPNTTVGGFFCSYYQSKTSEYYFFDD